MDVKKVKKLARDFWYGKPHRERLKTALQPE